MNHDLIPITRAARIVAPICDNPGYRGGHFEGGWRFILGKHSGNGVRREIVTPPPRHRFLTIHEAASPVWFGAIWSKGFSDKEGYDEFIAALFAWIEADGLLVSRTDVESTRDHPSGDQHAPLENVDIAGASWNFPQALAWIATRVPLEVARIDYASHWRAPLDDSTPRVEMLRAMSQNDDGRRCLIGWLVMVTAELHCKCGSQHTDDKERWESCKCVGNAYDELHCFSQSRGRPIPEYLPKPAYGSFSLTWPAGADNLKFTRAEIIAKWPADGNRGTTNWTHEMMKDWWTRKGHTNGKTARIAFMQLGDTRRLSVSFETAWKQEHTAGRGRPKKSAN